jgi:hypothetical protein
MGEQAKHTPGPWKVYHALLRPQFPGSKIIEVQDYRGEAVVTWSGFDNSDRLKKTHLANAHLIAAAPELRAALQELLLAAQPYTRKKADHRILLAYDAAARAIAKAEGRIYDARPRAKAEGRAA